MTGLVFGSLDLMGGGAVQLEALGTDSGTDWGNPGPIETQLNSFLQYGALVASEGWENRTVMVAVSVSGNASARAAAEIALAGEIGKRNSLIYTPPGLSVGTRYEVQTSSFDQVPNDLLEVANSERVYMLRLVCSPFALSTSETVVAALGPPPGTTTTANVFNGASASGWTATWNGNSLTPTTTTSAGRTLMGAVSPETDQRVQMVLQKIAAVDVSVTKYLTIDWAYSGGTPVGGLEVFSTGVSLLKVSEGASPISGDMRTIIKVPDSVNTLPDLTFWHTTDAPLFDFNGTGIPYKVTRSLYIDNIDRSTAGATGKQQLRSFTVGGSAPTTGSITVEHATAALGDGTMIFTYPVSDAAANGYTPQCTQFRVAGGPTPAPDSTAVSGFNVNLDATDFYSFPAMGLPDGEYAIWARMKSATNAPSVTFTLQQQIQGNAIGTRSDVYPVQLGGSIWKVVNLGVVHLPLLDTGITGSTLIGIGATNPSADDIYLDELWLFNMTIGVLTGVNLGNGTAAVGGPSRRLFIDSPSLANQGNGSIMRGHAADRSDSFSAYPSAFAPGIHRFPPGPMKAFTVVPNANDAQVSFRYAKAWYHTAAE